MHFSLLFHNSTNYRRQHNWNTALKYFEIHHTQKVHPSQEYIHIYIHCANIELNFYKNNFTTVDELRRWVWEWGVINCKIHAIIISKTFKGLFREGWKKLETFECLNRIIMATMKIKQTLYATYLQKKRKQK